jgi:hypothetical protein
MNKKQNNREWKPGQESLVVCIASIGLMLMAHFNYNSLVYREKTGTKGKILQNFFEYLDMKFGKEYVFGFLGLMILWTGINAIRGYSKRNEDK